MNRINEPLNGSGKINFNNAFITELLYKNGAKETINHVAVGVPDPNRMIHFKLSESEGLCINLDEVRRFTTTVKSIATVSDVKILS